VIVVTFKARSALIVLSHVTLPRGSVRERHLKLGNGKRDARHRPAPPRPITIPIYGIST